MSSIDLGYFEQAIVERITMFADATWMESAAGFDLTVRFNGQV
ncbi:MAG: hypothetical protein AAF539_08580 [Planctomycetota bacterium]